MGGTGGEIKNNIPVEHNYKVKEATRKNIYKMVSSFNVTFDSIGLVRHVSIIIVTSGAFL